MVVCADTSFLFSLYGSDVHSGKALAWARSRGLPIRVSELADYELGNALRFAEYRQALAPGRAAAFRGQFEADAAGGRIQIEVCNLAAVVAEARRMSLTHTLTGGHRAFDILHVAAALQMKADEFLTFDLNQRRLALAEGLMVSV